MVPPKSQCLRTPNRGQSVLGANMLLAPSNALAFRHLSSLAPLECTHRLDTREIRFPRQQPLSQLPSIAVGRTTAMCVVHHAASASDSLLFVGSATVWCGWYRCAVSSKRSGRTLPSRTSCDYCPFIYDHSFCTSVELTISKYCPEHR